jgi:hypothetical protein
LFQPLADLSLFADNHSLKWGTDGGLINVILELIDLGPEPFDATFPGIKFEKGIIQLLLAIDSAFGEITSALKCSFGQLLAGFVFLQLGLGRTQTQLQTRSPKLGQNLSLLYHLTFSNQEILDQARDLTGHRTDQSRLHDTGKPDRSLDTVRADFGKPNQGSFGGLPQERE